MPTLVLVTGAPGSSKTTLAVPLAEQLGVPLITKDTIKEALFEALGTGDHAWSTRLGGASFEVMFALARHSPVAVLEANFYPGHIPALQKLCSRPIQIVCGCPAAESHRRYVARASTRHAGHLDHLPVNQRKASMPWAPLELGGRVLRVDTSRPVDVPAVAAWVRSQPEWRDREAERSDDRHVTAPLPSWPTTPPICGSVVLREFTDQDTQLAVDLGEDSYIPLIGSLPAHPTAQQARAWVHRQRGRLAEGIGLSFAIAEATSDTAVGAIGLWLQNLSAGRATAGYAVSPAHRGCGIATSALQALTTFAWTIPALDRVELYIEPWNTSSIHVAESAGYQREGLLRSHQEIGGTRRDMLLHATTRP